MDTLGDRVESVKVKVGLGLIPALTSFVDMGIGVEDTSNKIGLAWMNWIPVLGAVRNSVLWIQQAGSKLFSGGGPAGVNKRASGGLASGRTIVGEQGFEIVDLPSGSYVHSNSASRNMMGGSFTLVYSPVFSLADRAELETKLGPMVKNIMRGR